MADINLWQCCFEGARLGNLSIWTVRPCQKSFFLKEKGINLILDQKSIQWAIEKAAAGRSPSGSTWKST